MPLWLDMLRTPMAAPETRDLRRLRRIWQVLCLLLAATVIAFVRFVRGRQQVMWEHISPTGILS